jgi:hypothetical protein
MTATVIMFPSSRLRARKRSESRAREKLQLELDFGGTGKARTVVAGGTETHAVAHITRSLFGRATSIDAAIALCGIYLDYLSPSERQFIDAVWDLPPDCLSHHQSKALGHIVGRRIVPETKACGEWVVPGGG